MGGLEIRNKSLRCEKCLDIKRLTIFPKYPEPILKMECRCSEKNSNLFEFLTEFKKKENFVIKCAKCLNINPKEPKYCYMCQKIYCNQCSDFHEQLSNRNEEKKENEQNEENNNIINNIFLALGHKAITMGNIDYQCIIHTNEKYAGFCKNCSLNICQKCINENIHFDHEISKFSDILLDQKKKDIISSCLGLCLDKISHNEKISKKIKKKIKSEENKKLITTLSKENKKINESILEFFYLMNDIYEKSKNMNYSIIFNARKNTAFNIRIINFGEGNEEEDALNLIEYLKNDFILETDYSRQRRKEEKEKQKEIYENQIVNHDSKAINKSSALNDRFQNKIEEEKIDDDKIIHTKGYDIIEEEEIKEEPKKKNVNLIETKKEEPKKEEIKEKVNLIRINKEEPKKEEIKKEEDKKDEIILKEIKKDEIKEEEDNKNIEIKIEIKKEGNKEEEIKKEEENKIENIKEEIKKDEIKEEEDKSEEVKIEIKQEENKDEENKIEEIKKEEAKIENESEKEKEKEPVEKKEIIIEQEKKEEKKPTHPLSSIEAKAELFKKMMQVKVGGMLNHNTLEKKNSTKNSENNIKIEPTKIESNPVEILSNLKLAKVAKKKPKKINFDV